MISTDKFPEAFRRFKQDVPTRQIKTFRQLTLAFGSWAGEKWRGTSRQMDALAVQARRLGIPLEYYRSRQQQVSAIFQTPREKRIATEQQKDVKGERSFQEVIVIFNSGKARLQEQQHTKRRVINYIRNHPNASLAEARGHRTKRS